MRIFIFTDDRYYWKKRILDNLNSINIHIREDKNVLSIANELFEYRIFSNINSTSRSRAQVVINDKPNCTELEKELLHLMANSPSYIEIPKGLK